MSILIERIRRQMITPLFPYTTLFRSARASAHSTWLRETPASSPGSPSTRSVRLSIGSDGRVTSASRTVWPGTRSEEHTSELQSQSNLVCRLLLEKKKRTCGPYTYYLA